VALMRLYERFCQVRVLTFCVMSNHFHLLLEVPAAPEDGGASWSDEDLLEHLECLYSEMQMRELRWELAHYRSQKNHVAAEEFRERFFARAHELLSGELSVARFEQRVQAAVTMHEPAIAEHAKRWGWESPQELQAQAEVVMAWYAVRHGIVVEQLAEFRRAW